MYPSPPLTHTLFCVQVLKELELLEEDAQVFKLIGPVLVKQARAETKMPVDDGGEETAGGGWALGRPRTAKN
jgi:hypothetical protein